MITLPKWFMNATGLQFSKDYRHGTTLRHRIVYKLINTVSSNWNNDKLAAEMRSFFKGTTS